MKTVLKNLLVVFLTFSGFIGNAQVALQNSSFEGEPQDATTPIGWLECEKETTPDILPGYWGVYLEPAEGNTYVGLITRSNGTWEAIGQRLKKPLKKSQCYSLSLQAAFSELYAGYNEPIILRIWGGANRCEKTQLLAETKPITHAEWKLYTFKFEPDKTLKYIIFEAYYNTDKKLTHSGNILLDAISPIVWCPRA